MIRVARQIKCLIAQAPGFIPHPLPEVNFLMVEIPTFKPYIYSLFSYLFIKQDQMIMTCNSAVASLMLSRFFYLYLHVKGRKKYPSHNTVSYFIYLYLHVEEGNSTHPAIQ